MVLVAAAAVVVLDAAAAAVAAAAPADEQEEEQREEEVITAPLLLLLLLATSWRAAARARAAARERMAAKSFVCCRCEAASQSALLWRGSRGEAQGGRGRGWEKATTSGFCARGETLLGSIDVPGLELLSSSALRVLTAVCVCVRACSSTPTKQRQRERTPPHHPATARAAPTIQNHLSFAAVSADAAGDASPAASRV
jgi:hypothetical protein